MPRAADLPVGIGLLPPGQDGSGTASRVIPSGTPAGSCIVVVVTDGALDSVACRRLARRAGLGLARTGSTGHHASGEIFRALATGLRTDRDAHTSAGLPFEGVVQLLEERRA